MLIHKSVGTTPAVLGFGALTAVVMGAYDFTGGKLSGYSKDPEVDEFDRKEFLRKNRRRPIEQTISELGEGRGMFQPSFVCYNYLTSSRNLWSRLCGAQSGENKGEVWY